MANEWNLVIKEVASRMNAIFGPQSGAIGQIGTSEHSYNVTPLTTAEVKDASYNYSMIVDACANAEQLVAQAIGATNNHPWRHVLAKGQLNGTGSGLTYGAPIYVSSNNPIKNCLGLGPVTAIINPGPNQQIRVLRETPLEDIQRRVENPGSFFQRQVYFYRIQDDRIFHTQSAVFIDYYGYDRTDTTNNIPNGTILFPHTAIPMYIAGALSMLLKEEEYAAQCQYYSTLFATMLQQTISGFGAVDTLGAPMPTKGAEST